MSISLIILLSLAALMIHSVLAAADSKSAAAPAMDPKVMEAMQPGPEHQQLAKLVGTWNVACSMWMKPDAEATQSKGTCVFRHILDRRFVQGDFSGSFMDKPFNGLAIIGYDRAAKRYVSTWCDSMATSFVCLKGTSSDNGRTITYAGDMVCPQQGPTTVRQVETHDSDSRFSLVMYQTPEGGKESKSMELVYTRRP